MRDLRMILYKLKYVLLPRMREENGKELRKCKFLEYQHFKINKRGFMGTFIIMFIISSVKLIYIIIKRIKKELYHLHQNLIQI